jgi:hypothetical protein
MKMKRAVLFVAGLLCMAGCSTVSANSTVGGGTPITPSTAPCLSITVPAYFSTLSIWKTAVADSPWNSKVSRIIILNPNSGPGTAADPNNVTLVTTVHNAGGKVYGYVPTGYGADPIATVEAEIQNYITWYGVDGIFLDEASSNSNQIAPYYQPLANFITSKISGGGVMLNPGLYPDASYAAIVVPSTSSLQIVVFEHDYTTFTGVTAVPPGWSMNYPASMFVDIVYATPSANVANALSLAKQRNVGTVYITDQDLPNPYTTLPSYWSTLVQTSQAGC